jgi:putative ABC transport system ATP-binding protein
VAVAVAVEVASAVVEGTGETSRTRSRDMIELKSVTKVYHMGRVEVPALQGVDLNIREGEMVAIMGPSGSGKSTLMNIIGCLDVPTSGSYVLEGEDVGRLGDDRLADLRNRNIGFVFQTYNLLPRLTALSNVELPLLYGNGRDRRRRSLEALERVGLGPRASHRPAELSGGEQQRVGIARALAKDPAILLADEPTGNLDSRSSQEIMAILQGLNRDERITVIIVTHEPDIAAHTGRVISMLDGGVVGDEPVREPRQAVVAGMERGQP